MAEPDTEEESETVEPKQAEPEEPKRRIAISSDGRSVEVEGPDGLLETVAVVAELWKLTERPQGQALGFGGATLYTEIIADKGDQEDE